MADAPPPGGRGSRRWYLVLAVQAELLALTDLLHELTRTAPEKEADGDEARAEQHRKWDQELEPLVSAMKGVEDAVARLAESGGRTGPGWLDGVPDWLGTGPGRAAHGPRAGLRLLEDQLASGAPKWLYWQGALEWRVDDLRALWESSESAAAASAAAAVATGAGPEAGPGPASGSDPGSASASVALPVGATVPGPRPPADAAPTTDSALATAPATAPVQGAPGADVVFPVVDAVTGSGFLVELRLRPEGQADASEEGAEEQRLNPTFRKGLRAGRDAALELARKVGVDASVLEEWRHVTPRVRGVPERYKLEDLSAGVGTAVAVLGHLLALPVPECLVSGAIKSSGIVTDLPSPEQYAVKETAARDHGLSLLPLSSGEELEDVCRRLWPREWGQVLAATARAALAVLGHEARVIDRVETDVTADGRRFALIPSTTVDDIRQRLDAGASAIVVGGPRSSTRTTSVRRAALKWQADHGTPVVELRPDAGRLPDEAELRHAITLARNATGVPSGEPALVVLEDLLAHQDATDLETVLPSAAAATSSTVIAVCLYSGGSIWRSNAMATVPVSVKHETVRAFCKDFVELNGLAGPDDVRVEVIRRAAAQDFWLLVNDLMGLRPAGAGDTAGSGLALAATATLPRPVTAVPEAAANPAVTAAARKARERDEAREARERDEAREQEAARQAETVRRAFVRRVRAGVTGKELALVKAVAAASLLRIGVPEEVLTGIQPAVLRRVGASRDSAKRWYIKATSVCLALLATEEPVTDDPRLEARRAADAQYEALAPLLRDAADGPSPKTVSFATALVSAADSVGHDLRNRLLLLVTPMLTALGAEAPPGLLAHAVLADMEHDEQIGLLKKLLRAIGAGGWGVMSGRQATTCLSAIRKRRELAVQRFPTLYSDVLERIGRDMGPVLARTDPAQGVLLVHVLGSYWEGVTAAQVAPLALKATSRCDPSVIEHYHATNDLVDALLKYGGGRRADLLKDFARAPGVRRLLEADHREAGLILAQAALTLVLDPWREHPAEPYERTAARFSAALPHSSLYSVTRGLALLGRVGVWDGRQIVRASTIVAWLKNAVLRIDAPRVTPWQTAQLVQELGRIDSPTCIRALYGPDGVTPDPAVLEMLVDRILAMGDLKGVGHVVTALTPIDRFWGPGDRGICAELCTRLGVFIDEALEKEDRGSVVLRLMSALVGADVPAPALTPLLERCVERVAVDAEANEKDHAPRLALLLGRHPVVGQEFMERLAPLIDDYLLLRRATRAGSAETRSLYLDLTRLLGRNLDSEFLGELSGDDGFATALRELDRQDVTSALKVVRSFGLALQDAGASVDYGEMLRYVERDPVVWALRLKWTTNPDKLVETLHLLRNLDVTFARACLRELDRLKRPEATIGARLPSPARIPSAAPSPPSAAPELPIPAAPSPGRVAELAQRSRARQAERDRRLPGILWLAERRFTDADQAVRIVHAVRAIDEDGAGALAVSLSSGARWSNRVRNILDTESPVELGNLLRMMAGAGVELPDRVLKELFGQWLPRAHEFRSPAVVQSMVRGLAACQPENPEMARRWASRLALSGIGHRLGRGLPTDMGMSGLLLETLDVWGPAGSATELASALPPGAAADTLAGSVRLLGALQRIAPDAAREHAGTVGALVAAHAEVRYVRDPETHWRDIGWLVRHARALAGPDAVPADEILRLVRNGCRRAEAVAWVTGCLGLPVEDTDWSPAGEPPTGWARAARLLIRSDLGLIGPGEETEVREVLGSASPGWLAALVRSARLGPPWSRPLTDADLRFLQDLGQWHVDGGQPRGAELMHEVSRFRPELK
ncbi:hypothetical protein KUM39_02915 [Streptomyces sp. J2-1]|uniref:hypothetical protein n=1 Tax=Streptomyces corallincola TaxID=2851888 RepID=UPI001C38FA82|nr:hypothetical protein [Streptomyces corallincola]MBV2353321.1 hypothetical protein [Streptomyces corallincola]